MCCGEEGSERTPSSYLTILHVQSGQLCVCGGRRVVVHVMANRRLHARKKRKALANHHLFFTNQIVYRRRGARISGNSHNATYLLKFSNFKCRGPNKAPFAPAFAPFTELWNGCSYRDFENREQITVPLRCENHSPPHPEIRAPTPGAIFLGRTYGYRIMKNTI